MSRDAVESEPAYQYVRGNPINRVDPSGKQGDPNRPECYQPVAPGDISPYGCTLPTICYQPLAEGDIYPTYCPPPPVFDPLSEQQWSIVKQEARRFGLPKELVGATVAAEIVYDTDWHDVIPDFLIATTGSMADFAYRTRDRPFFDTCYGTLWGFHEYFGLAPYLEPKGLGYGMAPGLAHIHAGPAVRTENYINETYPGQNLLPDLGNQNREGVRLRTLLTDEGNIRYAAAYLRWWADIRKRSTSSHTTDLTDTDMIIIYTVYRCSALDCYDSIEGFQNAQTPSSWGSPNDFAVFLPLYKNKP